MKKRYVFLMFALIIYILSPKVKANVTEEIIKSQADTLGISSFLEDSQKYTEDTFGELDIEEIFTKSITGNVDNNTLINILIKIFGENIKSAILTVSSVIVIIIIHSILKAISENLGNENVSKIAYFIEYILIVTVVMTNFSNIIAEMKIAVQNLTAFANSLIPLLITLMITTGSIVSSSMLQPLLLLLVTFISNFMTNIIIPIILVSTAIGIISKISDDTQVSKISKFLKNTMVWILVTVFTLFVSISSLEGTLTASVDGVTSKAAKTAISTVVPVIGKILGDAVSTIMGCSNIIKNAVGFVGIIVILGICIKPIITLAALAITYNLGAALCEPIADKKIVGIMETMGGTFKIFLAIMCGITFLLIVGIAIVMKISNSGLMYN